MVLMLRLESGWHDATDDELYALYVYVKDNALVMAPDDDDESVSGTCLSREEWEKVKAFVDSEFARIDAEGKEQGDGSE